MVEKPQKLKAKEENISCRGGGQILMGSASVLFELLFLLLLLGGVFSILYERVQYSTIFLTLVILVVGYLYLQIEVYFSLLTFLLNLIFLPLYLGIVFLLNKSLAYFHGQKPVNRSSDKEIGKEMRRKSLHLLVFLLFLPLSYFKWFFSFLKQLIAFFGMAADINQSFRVLLLFAMGGVVLPVLLVENFRLRGKLQFHPSILREKEKGDIGAYVNLVASSLFLSLFFYRFIETDGYLIAAITTAVIYDTFSALFGTATGKTFVQEERSLEGAIGGGIVTFSFALYCLNLYQATLSVFVLCLVDLLHPPIDDNLLLPVATAFSLILFS
ncbi:MAG: hypothetical protein GWO20_07350 [Candidatus Korarchaeota archaeon]|nr:hypothetical protein [Candidatus Korarchaeota archaeon]NIU83263.1 hypothetical protein [Candidatus Thorarchaeota archaeon]NIW51703.1 hypothetical protein [Candidatus Korarchaeota archaeon]